MILTKNKPNIKISSLLFNNINTNNKVTLVSNKNCCSDSIKVLTLNDINSQSVVTVKDNIYYPTSVTSKLFSLTFTKNNINYVFQLNSNNNLYTNISNIISSFNSWKQSYPDFITTTLVITNIDKLITITVNNLKSGYSISDAIFINYNNVNYKGEIVNNEAYYNFGYIDDGIYKFKIISENLITGSKTTEENCIPILDSAKCLIPENIISNPNSVAHLLYQTLVSSENCNCICDDMCSIYNSLIEELKWN